MLDVDIGCITVSNWDMHLLNAARISLKDESAFWIKELPKAVVTPLHCFSNVFSHQRTHSVLRCLLVKIEPDRRSGVEMNCFEHDLREPPFSVRESDRVSHLWESEVWMTQRQKKQQLQCTMKHRSTVQMTVVRARQLDEILRSFTLRYASMGLTVPFLERIKSLCSDTHRFPAVEVMCCCLFLLRCTQCPTPMGRPQGKPSRFTFSSGTQRDRRGGPLVPIYLL